MRDENSKKSKLSWSKTLVGKWFNSKSKAQAFHANGGVGRDTYCKKNPDLSWQATFGCNEAQVTEKQDYSLFFISIYTKSKMEVDQEQIESFGVFLKQGAEARIFESMFVGRRSIVKNRFSKKYRHPVLDSKLTLKRLNAEARCMTKARKLGVPTPVLYAIDPLLHTLTFEFVEGKAVKDILIDFGLHGINEELMNELATQIGVSIAKLHDGGLIHGDLTTSNMIIQKGTNQLVLIDFGLSFNSTIPEDKAVDLYVLERALLSMHSSCGNVMDKIFAAYRKSSKQWSSTMNKLAQVRLRGRKRTMIG